MAKGKFAAVAVAVGSALGRRRDLAPPVGAGGPSASTSTTPTARWSTFPEGSDEAARLLPDRPPGARAGAELTRP